MAKNNKNRKNTIEEPRVNDELHGNYDVRLIYTDDNEETKNIVCPLSDAKRRAVEMDLDLIEISRNANPPVLKIADYSKYRYELKKQAKAKKQTNTELKEISLSVNISMHDIEIKANKAREFINKGHKVKVTLMMKKRETLRREESKKSLLEFIVMLSDVAVPEFMPKDEGNRTIVILRRKQNANS